MKHLIRPLVLFLALCCMSFISADVTYLPVISNGSGFLQAVTATLTPTPTSTFGVTETGTPTETETPTPTLHSTIPPTKTATATDTPTATPTSTPFSSVMTMDNHSARAYLSDYLSITGVVVNDGEVPVQYIRMYASLYSLSGQVLSTDFSYVINNSLMPGEFGCYNILIFEPPSDWGYYEVNGFYQVGGNLNPPMEVTDLIETPGFLGFDILGQVKNVGSQQIEFIRTAVTVVDGPNGTGQVIGCATGYTNQQELVAGQRSVFSTSFYFPVPDGDWSFNVTPNARLSAVRISSQTDQEFPVTASSGRALPGAWQNYLTTQ